MAILGKLDVSWEGVNVTSKTKTITFLGGLISIRTTKTKRPRR